MIVICSHRQFSSIFEMSVSSILILPPDDSTILHKERHMEDFPAPVQPTTPIFSYGFILNEREFSTVSVLDLYYIE